MNGTPKIAINATLTRVNPTGLAVYINELCLALLKTECDFDFTVYSGSEELKRFYPDKVMLVPHSTSPALGLKGNIARLLWQQMILPIKLRRQKASLLYSTVHEGILTPHLKQIVTIHDVLPMRYLKNMYPRYKYYFCYILPILLKNSHSVICISENTKRDVIAYYDIKDKPIYVIHEGLNKQKFYPREKDFVHKRYGLTEYLLYIGDMRPYKNLERSLEAFAGLNLKHLKFVIGGNKDPRFYPRIKNKTEELSLNDRVVFLDYVSEQDLPHLYSEAAAFVFTSLYEGFGLPPLEAMACGCPVVASNAASLLEVCGDAAYYINPYSVESITEGMHKVLTDDTLRHKLINQGLERAKVFSWERCALEHLSVFKEALSL